MGRRDSRAADGERAGGLPSGGDALTLTRSQRERGPVGAVRGSEEEYVLPKSERTDARTLRLTSSQEEGQAPHPISPLGSVKERVRVACVVVPHFAVEVERLLDPTLRGRPVVVGGAPEERREVLDCSAEAMERGVRPGMTLREALSRCAEAAFVEAHPERYRATMLAMVGALLELSPLVEPAEPGVIYVGVDAELAPMIAAAAEAAAGLRVRVGVGEGKFAAYVAAVRGEGGERPPARGEGLAVLAGLPIEDLPVSVEMRRRLRVLGLRTLGELARLPKGPVAAQFGAEGARAWELARGIDRAPIIPYRPPLAIVERLVFPVPVDTLDALLTAARVLLHRALRRPEARGRAARGLRLSVETEDGRVWTRELTFREPTSSEERMLLALRSKIEAFFAASAPRGGPLVPPGAPFVQTELAVLELCGESARQEKLFRRERGSAAGARAGEQLAVAARQLKARYGRPVLRKVVEVEPWSRIPERRFALIDYDP